MIRSLPPSLPSSGSTSEVVKLDSYGARGWRVPSHLPYSPRHGRGVKEERRVGGEFMEGGEAPQM